MLLIKPKLIRNHVFLCLPAMDKTRVTCKYYLKKFSTRRSQTLQGSMFWRWDLIIYEKQPRADYGVRIYDTTLALIKKHAGFMSQWQASQPPAASCGLQCWVPDSSGNRYTSAPSSCFCWSWELSVALSLDFLILFGYDSGYSLSLTSKSFEGSDLEWVNKNESIYYAKLARRLLMHACVTLFQADCD